MSDFQYEFDENQNIWHVLVNGSPMDSYCFMDMISRWFIENGIQMSGDENESHIMGANCNHIHDAARRVVTATDKSGNLIKTPVLFSSWVRINLDYAQRSVFMRAFRQAKFEFTNNPPEDESVEDATDNFAKAKVRDFSTFLVGHDKLFGDLSERKKKKRKK